MNISTNLINKHKKIFIKKAINADEMYNLRIRYTCKYYRINRGFCTNRVTGKNCPFVKERMQGRSCTTLFAVAAGYNPVSRKESIEKYNSSKRMFVKNG